MMQNCADCCILNSVFAQSHPLSVVEPVTENWNGIFILLLYYTNFFDIFDYHSFKYKQGRQGNSSFSAAKISTPRSIQYKRYGSAFGCSKLRKVMTLVTSGISSIFGLLILGLLLSRSRFFFRGARNVMFCQLVLLSILLTK